MLDKPPPFSMALPRTSLRRCPRYSFYYSACMTKAIHLCLRTTEMIVGWAVLIILAAFFVVALPVLCLALFWL